VERPSPGTKAGKDGPLLSSRKVGLGVSDEKGYFCREVAYNTLRLSGKLVRGRKHGVIPNAAWWLCNAWCRCSRRQRTGDEDGRLFGRRHRLLLVTQQSREKGRNRDDDGVTSTW